MKKTTLAILLVGLLFSCKKQESNEAVASSINTENTLRYAQVFQIQKQANYSLLTIKKPFQKGSKTYQYILKKAGKQVPDSLLYLPQITVPIQSIVVTSTTHIPALELLGVEDKLVGFPGTDYISSAKTRALIANGKIKELNSNQALNVETLLVLKPDVVVAFGVNNLPKVYQTIQNSHIPVLVNGDWMEETTLGKAAWIKFFGALFAKEKQADSIFLEIEKNYINAKKLAAQATHKPTVFAGALQGDKWVLPGGKSWVASFLKDANCNYLWASNTDTGSIKISFENVLLKAKNADFWLAPGFYDSKLKLAQNKHYQEFKAFQEDKIFSFTTKKGVTGGLLYFEQAPQHPDWVLQDLIHIFHPELLPNYENHFFEKLN